MAAKPEGKSKRGGPRAGSGRKPSPVLTIRRQIAEDKSGILSDVESAIVDFLPRAIANMIILANGGYEKVEEKYTVQPSISIGPPGHRTETDAELVLSERKVSIAEPDRGANQYLIDRALGKSVQRVEDVTKLSDAELIARAKGMLAGDGSAGAVAPG